MTLELFFDGACPLCSREVKWLQRFDRNARIVFTDISARGFDPAPLGVTQDDLLARIHARLPDGRMIEGVEVFRRAYTAIGLGPLVNLSRLPGVNALLERAYAVFARNRLRLTGRSEACNSERCEAFKRA
jgi:predicted DCC family thiol-disulfide oxidoreductase YuxK